DPLWNGSPRLGSEWCADGLRSPARRMQRIGLGSRGVGVGTGGLGTGGLGTGGLGTGGLGSAVGSAV
ncbi:MAG: hypothetical protein AAGE52_19135, partial [Myxococcota bacterium]